MAELRDVAAYLCKHYPHKRELSKARLTKMVYLADWKSAITRNQPITNIEWIFNKYGPYVEDVVEIAKEDPAFTVDQNVNAAGDNKELITVKDDVEYPSLTESDKEILDFVIKTTSPKYWDAFIQLVYSTYPIVTQSRFSKLNLIELAQRYKEEKALLVK
jgi:uncharacterized protein YwgA